MVFPKLSIVTGFAEHKVLPVRFKNKNNKCKVPSTSVLRKSLLMLSVLKKLNFKMAFKEVFTFVKY